MTWVIMEYSEDVICSYLHRWHMGNGIGRSSLCCSSLRWLPVPGNGNISERETKNSNEDCSHLSEYLYFPGNFINHIPAQIFWQIILNSIFPHHTNKGLSKRWQDKLFQTTNFSAVLTRQEIQMPSHSERTWNTS